MLNGQPLVFDGYCGLGGWAEGFLEEGWRVIGFDVERHDYGTGGYPGELVLQDVTTLHGSQLKDADCLVFSPPCIEFSYMSMPWRRAKQIAAALRGEGEFPSGYRGSRTIAELTALFDCCFRLQREASEAAGHHIPMVIENVKGAQPWVGRARAHFGSYYLWGDVPALMPSTLRIKRPGRNFHAFENGLGSSPGFNGGEHETRHVKNSGGSWFAIGSPGQKEVGRNPVTGEGIKQHGSGAAWFDKALDERRKEATATKMQTAGAGLEYGGGFGWDGSAMRTGNSKSSARKAASAQIARIPPELSRWIARCYYPAG